MFDYLGDLFVRWMDAALGWTLSMPRDVTLIIVSVLSAGLLIALRPFCTPQDWLRRCDDDKKRQTELMKEAKARKDKDAVKRHRLNKGMIGLRAMKCEGWPLLAALLPLIIIGVWAFARLEFVSPAGDQPVNVKVTFPAASNGDMAHILPADGVKIVDGAVKKIADGSATWKIQAAARPEPYTLSFVFDGQKYQRKLLVGQKIYESETVDLDADRGIAATVEMEPSRPLGTGFVLPAWNWLTNRVAFLKNFEMPAWIVAYIVFVIPLVIVIKRVTGVH